MAVWECYRRSDGETLVLNHRNTINGLTWALGPLFAFPAIVPRFAHRRV